MILRFEVKDTGCGIPQDKFEKVFEKFEQADDTVTAAYGGTGLGLSICKLFIELMGGMIWIDPERTIVGVGTTFCFSVPCEIIEDNCPDPLLPIPISDDGTVGMATTATMMSLSSTPSSSASASVSACASSSSAVGSSAALSSAEPVVPLEKLLPLPPEEIEILVVDDNKVNTIVCSRIISQLGFKTPSIATSGEEAHRMAIIHHYDVILMDFNVSFPPSLSLSFDI